MPRSVGKQDLLRQVQGRTNQAARASKTKAEESRPSCHAIGGDSFRQMRRLRHIVHASVAAKEILLRDV
jgi:hypothetical protein